MPEVCEVCLTSQYLKKIIGDSITNITVTHGRYSRTPIKGISSITYPLDIIDIQTKGKFMWMTLKHDNDTIYMLNTFGLTGRWSFNELDHISIIFTLRNSHDLYFDDMRNFGTIEFTKDVKKLNKKLDMLGEDLLQSTYTPSDIQKRFDSIKNQKKKIVVVLMAQDKKNGIGSGLGNYLVPEILYTAKISPHRTIDSLTKKDIINLTNAIKTTLYLCYNYNTTDYVSHLKKFLSSHRKYVLSGKFPDFHSSHKNSEETNEFKVYRRKIDDNGHKVVGEHIIKGRTTYWVPDVQH
jgi:formamidopyrimidine-DNA glycosylase